MNEEIVKKFFAKEVKQVKQGNCPTCGKKIGEFRNKISEREFIISGMCQECQDSVFGKD